MKEKKLIIICRKKKFQIDENNVSYINIGDGLVHAEKSNQIFLKTYRNFYYEKFKSILVNNLKKKIILSKKKLPFISELELFNLRNDKDNNFDLILNILIIREIIKKKKFNDIKVITDNSLVKKIFQTNFPKISVLYEGTNLNKPKLILLKIIKFYIKTFVIISFIKLFNKNNSNYKKSNEAALSIYPIFFKEKKEIFFNDSKKIKFNFLLSDETHLNHNTIDVIKVINKTSSTELVHIEKFISYKMLLKALLKSISFYTNSYTVDMNFDLDNLDLNNFYKNYFYSSLINRCKLNIYEDAFIVGLKKNNIKKFSLYLFEYNFGFFLINLIKSKANFIKVEGYQHGIFSNQLLWLDIIYKIRDNLNYLPHIIKAFHLASLNDYKSKIKSKKIKFYLLKKKKSQLSLDYKNSKKKTYSNKILVLPGTHDAKKIYDEINNKNIDNKSNVIFYIKFHPKKVIYAKDAEKLKVIKTIKNKMFSDVLISSTSTLVYDFLNMKKRFMVYNFDNKQNLISSNLKKKIRFYNF